ncbi:hypothetical protein V3N04_14080 [Acinetobacter baumannii]
MGKKYKISPESLPVAHINQEYQQIIKISGGKVIDKYAELETNIPENLGITVKPVDDLDGYNRPLAKVVIASSSDLPVQRLS